MGQRQLCWVGGGAAEPLPDRDGSGEPRQRVAEPAGRAAHPAEPVHRLGDGGMQLAVQLSCQLQHALAQHDRLRRPALREDRLGEGVEDTGAGLLRTVCGKGWDVHYGSQHRLGPFGLADRTQRVPVPLVEPRCSWMVDAVRQTLQDRGRQLVQLKGLLSAPALDNKLA